MSSLHKTSISFTFSALLAAATYAADPLAQWPEVTATMRPWTRWWWLGSGVDKPNLERMLQQFRDVGEGGVEICPIYGAKGYEARFVDFLSPRWVDLLSFTTTTAHQLGLGVDLTTGTGWPMGGPWIPNDQASMTMTLRTAGGAAAGTAPAAGAPGRSPSVMDGLMEGGRRDERMIANAEGYTAVVRQPVQQVKRAAPGDRGNVIDPYSIRSLDTFLTRFDGAFQQLTGPAPRAEFHDSFEYFGANWSPELPAEFRRRRGYDLLQHLPALAGSGDPEVVAAVAYDYRLTIAELHLEWVARWTQWSHGHGSLTREQAHGAPANIEDVYAAADIPETEGSFAGGDDSQIPFLKFASSAAHVTGKPLASSETFTWLGEHFQVRLADLKPVADRFFLSGINHIFYHGTPYSPEDAPWPGWLFYASVNFGPNGGLWHDLPAFNAYATRVQSVLQSGAPDNDVLLYFPAADFWQRVDPPTGPRGRAAHPSLVPFGSPGKWMADSSFAATATQLWKQGYAYDIVTDALLDRARFDAAKGTIVCATGSPSAEAARYKVIVVPAVRFMPLSTAAKLAALARSGARVVLVSTRPEAVPGLLGANRREPLRALVANLPLAENLPSWLAAAKVRRETMFDEGLACIRRSRADGGKDYFIVNRRPAPFDGPLELASPAIAAVALDPLFPERGAAALDVIGGRIRLQLDPGASLILRTSAQPTQQPHWVYTHPAATSSLAVSGPWRVTFLSGGPALPSDFTSSQLGSWTDRDDTEAKRFAGTAVYRSEFTVEGPVAGAGYRLDLGRVGDSARVRLNGKVLGTVWTEPFVIATGDAVHSGRNQLEIEVTNLAANRIADLDRRHVVWKSFYEINFVNLGYKPFDASTWPLRPSGLLGPVQLIPLTTAASDPR